MRLIHWVEVGKGFYNLKHSFYENGGFINIGTHMSLLHLESSGKFLVLDTCCLSTAAKIEFDYLTNNGILIEAILATHPFHTTYFESFYRLYPSQKYYGTPRHIKIIPSIPWAGDISSEEIQKKYEPCVFMKIPNGAEFVNPDENNRFSSVFVFHAESKTIHDDDTLMYFDCGNINCCSRLHGIKGDKLSFSSMRGLGRYPESASIFKKFIQSILNDWNFENIVTAHYGILMFDGKKMLRRTLHSYEKIFQKIARRGKSHRVFAGGNPNHTTTLVYRSKSAMKVCSADAREDTDTIKELAFRESI